MLGRLLAAVGLAALEGEFAAFARRARRRAILTVIAVLLWVVAFAFALAALTVWLASAVGAIWACAVLAGGFAVVAIILQAIAASQKRRKPPAALAQLLEQAAGKDGAGTAFGLIAIVAVAGYMLGRNFLRR